MDSLLDRDDSNLIEPHRGVFLERRVRRFHEYLEGMGLPRTDASVQEYRFLT